MKISRILLTILPLFLLSGCGISRAEKRELNLTSYKAKDYYEEKYDCDIDITGSSYDYYISVFRTYDTTKMIFTTSEDTIIFYDTELETFYDNRQADEILDTFHLELLPKLLDPIPYPYHFVTTNEEVELGEKNFSDYGSHNLFHKYFEKDSYKDFFRKEMPSVKFWEPLYITSETSPDHKKITEDIETAFSACSKIKIRIL